MKALILGCGYLGGRVAKRWLAAGHEVAALTRSAARAEQLRQQGIIPCLGDVTDAASLADLPPADVVLYAIGYDRSSGDRRTVVVDGLNNTLEALRSRADHLVFISTTSVYGQSDGEWVDEGSAVEPASEAGQTALEAEDLVRESRIPDVMILRLTGIYGPNRLLRRVEQLQAGEPIAGSGEAWLNLIHVDDAASAVIRAAEQLQMQGPASASGERLGAKGGSSRPQCYVVTDDRPVRRREYYDGLARLSGSLHSMFDETVSSRIAGLGKRCRNDAVKRDLKLSLAYPTFVEGLIAAWRESDAT